MCVCVCEREREREKKRMEQLERSGALFDFRIFSSMTTDGFRQSAMPPFPVPPPPPHPSGLEAENLFLSSQNLRKKGSVDSQKQEFGKVVKLKSKFVANGISTLDYLVSLMK